MDLKARILAIRRIIEVRKIDNQETLARYLKEEGFRVTQATLLRDLKTIKVGKVPDGSGGYLYEFPNTDTRSGSDTDLIEDFTSGFESIDFSGCLGLIKTLPGHASSVASAVDNLEIKEILGTVAGDDTIMVFPKDGIPRENMVLGSKRKIPGFKEKI